MFGQEPISLVDFRGPPFDFWGGYGWFQKKYPTDSFREKKSMEINSWENNILLWKKYLSWRIMLKEYLSLLYVGENISNARGLGNSYTN